MWSTLKSQWRNFARDSVFTWSWRVSVAIALVTALTIAWYWQRLPPVVPLLYSLPWGEEQLAAPLGLIALFGAVLCLYVLNVVLAVCTYATSPLYSRMLILGGTILLGLTSITLLKIILLTT